MMANLGFNPMNNGESVIINVPPLTEERRRELAKQAKAEAEDAKVRVRNERKSSNNELKELDLSEDLKKNPHMDYHLLRKCEASQSMIDIPTRISNLERKLDSIAAQMNLITKNMKLRVIYNNA